MFCERESRLYHRCTVYPAALATFDEVCEQHHEEMTVIRPALVGKFKCAPVIEMYRQAAIRRQKVKEWSQLLASSITPASASAAERG